ncbi:MAG: WYL domain-containing protein [Planctomycetes bacterium]|nr:WYL domain-containing protein [Planctomycetota bacterium]
MAAMEFISFDLETTGLYPIRDRIIEIGAVRFSGNKILGKLETFVNPGMPIPPELTANVHGITDEMVANAPGERDAVENFLKFIGTTPLIAHNITFDIGFVSAVVCQHKIKTPRNILIDSCELSRSYIKGVANHKLSTLAEYLQIKEPTAHRAMADSLVVMRLFLACLKQMPPDITPEGIAQHIGQLISFGDYIFGDVELFPEQQVLDEAAKGNLDVEIEYKNNNGDLSRRWLSPYTLFTFKGRPYLVAYCHQSAEMRQFRIDRIVNVYGKRPTRQGR